MQIIFHIGPPKTGTSAIQYWLSKHHDWLLLNDFFYPSHCLDVNNVSSGNILSIFDDVGGGCYTFSENKYDSVISEAKHLGVNTVIFSSEFFFERVEELAEHIPDAKFILYLRNELEVVESSYNQSVKRHRKTEVFTDIVKPVSSSLRRILQYYKKLGEENFILRFYAPPLFVHGNIIADFLSSIGLEVSNRYFNNLTVNNSYTKEALELKRFFNRFADDTLHHKLDEFLQSVSIKKVDYSLMSPDAFRNAKVGYTYQIKEFLSLYQIHGSQCFLDYCEKLPQDTYYEQRISLKDALNLLQNFIGYFPPALSHLESIYKKVIALKTVDKENSVQQALRIIVERSIYIRISNFMQKLKFPLIGKTSKSPNIYSLEKLTPKQSITLGKQFGASSTVTLLSHHIPKTAGSSFGSALIQAFGRESVLGIYRDTGAHCLSTGKDLMIPDSVKILHGHFTTHSNQKVQFPNAKRICWIRDPAERLWSLTKHIVRNKQPIALYNAFLNYGLDLAQCSSEQAFEILLCKPEFSRVRQDYQRYFHHIKPDDFDFIGSMHRYSDEIKRLEKILEMNIQKLSLNQSPNKTLLREINPELYLKAKNVLIKEFELVNRYI